jgi:nucleotide-binding universal stress UspA family protein
VYRNILVPLDGSPFSEYALPFALGLLDGERGRLRLVHVYSPGLPAAYLKSHPTFDDRWELEGRRQVHDYLDELGRRLHEAGGITIEKAVREGPIPEALQEEAVEADSDLLVMTTHGRGVLTRAWLGSVADALVRQVTVPILLVRPSEEREPVVETAARFRHILVPLDGSSLAESILDEVVPVAQAAGARFTLIRVVAPLVGPNRSGLPARALPDAGRADASEYLEGVAERLRSDGLEGDILVTEHHQPPVAILAAVAERQPDLIAMATRGLGGWTRVAVGSVADKVIRGASVPVLLCRPHSSPTAA